MAAVYDSSGSAAANNVTSLTTAAFTIGAGANKAVMGDYTGDTNTIGITASLGTDAAMTIISGSDGGATSATVCLGRITALSGSQTAAFSWTNAQVSVAIAAKVATGVHQTTPFNNGNFTSATAGTTLALAITSTSGDLTATAAAASSGAGAPGPLTSDRTRRWNRETTPLSIFYGFAGDTGPGTGTTTHTWTALNTSLYGVSGANFVQAAGGAAGVQSILLSPIIAA